MQPGSFCQKPAAHRQAPGRTEDGLCKELPFFCALLEGFASLRPQRGRPRWLAKNKPEQWKLESNEITSESFVLLKYLQYCCFDDGWLFPFPTSYSTSCYLGFTTPVLMEVGWQERRCNRSTILSSARTPFTFPDFL